MIFFLLVGVGIVYASQQNESMSMSDGSVSNTDEFEISLEIQKPSLSVIPDFVQEEATKHKTPYLDFYSMTYGHQEAIHIPTPAIVRAVYMTSWVAGREDLKEALLNFIDETEVNAVVLDVIDDTGRVAYNLPAPTAHELGIIDNRVKDIHGLLRELHKRDIYVIGRIASFQNPEISEKKPEWAVLSKSTRKPWKDYKGKGWVDVSSVEMWDFLVEVALASHSVGFDEINFDYIRFPSDGPMNDVSYKDSVTPKAEQLEKFFSYIDEKMSHEGIVTSADVFGMVASHRDDLNIGQVLERAAPYFDYISPMVYPSHYPDGFIGLGDPNDHVYDIVKYSMIEGSKRLEAMGLPRTKLRPWLQDFDYGANYGTYEVEQQILAVYDAGIPSWMMWNASNRYTKDAYSPDEPMIE